MTANLREWRHFFALRALELTGPVHPQMYEVAWPVYEACLKSMPEVFRGIGPKDVEKKSVMAARRDIPGKPGKSFLSQDNLADQVRDLLDDIQRIRQTTCPENLPQGVYFVSQFASQHILYLYFVVVYQYYSAEKVLAQGTKW